MWSAVLLTLYLVQSASPTGQNQGEILPKIHHLETLLNEQSQQFSNFDVKLSKVERNNQKKCNFDEMYKNLVHTINFMDNKFNNYFMQIQNTMKNRDKFLEQFDETLKTRHILLTEQLMKEIGEFKRVQKHLMDQLINKVEESRNITKDFMKSGHDKLEGMLATNERLANVSEIRMRSIEAQLNNDLNEYATKVGDMSTTAYENNAMLKELLEEVREEVHFNLSRIYDAITTRPENEPFEKITLDEIEESDTNAKLDRIITSQETFMENCHRLQSNEVQIEQEISEIMKRLIQMLDERKLFPLRKIESNLSGNRDIEAVFEKLARDNEVLGEKLNAVENKLDDLMERVAGCEKIEQIKDEQQMMYNEMRMFMNASSQSGSNNFESIEEESGMEKGSIPDF